jgi:hypothetical protein
MSSPVTEGTLAELMPKSSCICSRSNTVTSTFNSLSLEKPAMTPLLSIKPFWVALPCVKTAEANEAEG